MAREAGLEFAGISAGKYRRNPGQSFVRNLSDLRSTALNLRDVGLMSAGVAQSLRILRRFKPDVVFAKGGFVALPVATAARMLGIPVVAHESDVSPGMGSKIVSKWASVMAVGFPTELYGNSLGNRLLFTGNPVRPELLQGNAKQGVEQAFGKDKAQTKADPVLLIIGGSQGARTINNAVLEGLTQLAEHYRVIHVVGEANLAEAESYAREHKVPATRYQALGFVDAATLANFYAAADLVISRAGANTIAELAALRKPVLLIPNNQMAAHQVANAERLRQAGAVELLHEDDLSGARLVQTVGLLLKQPHYLKELADKLAAFNTPDAAGRIARALMEQAR